MLLSGVEPELPITSLDALPLEITCFYGLAFRLPVTELSAIKNNHVSTNRLFTDREHQALITAL